MLGLLMRQFHSVCATVASRARLALSLLAMAALALAGGGVVQVVGDPHRINAETAELRWEPSSSDGGNWAASWFEFTSFRGYTAAWGGVAGWGSRVEQRAGGNATFDHVLGWDPKPERTRHVLVMQESGPNSIWYTYSLDALGTQWNPPVRAMAASSDAQGTFSWDFPSIAVADNGSLVIGASRIRPTGNDGYYTVLSTDGGASWSAVPSPVVQGSGTGGVSRVTASGNVFHAFVRNTVYGNITLNRYESMNGSNWGPANLVAQFIQPLFLSPDTYSNSCVPDTQPCSCSGAGCGQIAYASDPDAVGPGGLGWVVAFQYNVAGQNVIAVCSAGGCDSFNHTTDLFVHGITTSSRAGGDYWLSYLTYSGAPNRYLPLVQGVVYRTSTGAFLGAQINNGIDPKAWKFFGPGDAGYRCRPFPLFGSNPCFSQGDYARPASNVDTGGSIPLIRESALFTTDLMQTFVQDPGGTATVPQFLPRIEHFPVGADLRPRGVITPALRQQLAARSPLDVSTLFVPSAAARAR